MKKLAIAAAALLLTGCASTPQPKQPPAAHHKAPSVKQVAKPIESPVAVPGAKPTTFRQRWYDRFMKHKSK